MSLWGYVSIGMMIAGTGLAIFAFLMRYSIEIEVRQTPIPPMPSTWLRKEDLKEIEEMISLL
jgi:hypothetical protein